MSSSFTLFNAIKTRGLLRLMSSPEKLREIAEFIGKTLENSKKTRKNYKKPSAFRPWKTSLIFMAEVFMIFS